jgi:hypothetical protein
VQTAALDGRDVPGRPTMIELKDGGQVHRLTNRLG